MLDIVILDVEASGLSEDSYPIEVGFAQGSRSPQSRLIDPEWSMGWEHWDPEAQALHGLDREALTREGDRPVVVARWLNEHLAGKVAYSDGAQWDSFWLGRLFEEAMIPMGFRVESLQSLLVRVAGPEALAVFEERCRAGCTHRVAADIESIRKATAEIAP